MKKSTIETPKPKPYNSAAIEQATKEKPGEATEVKVATLLDLNDDVVVEERAAVEETERESARESF